MKLRTRILIVLGLYLGFVIRDTIEKETKVEKQVINLNKEIIDEN